MQTKFTNPRFLRACLGETVDRTPVWIMRQAGRYLPEYRAIRAKHSFREVMTTPSLAAEVTLQPIRRFPLDAAIIFCDILIVPEAMGLGFEIVPGTGPVMERRIQTAADIDRLRPVDPERDFSYLTKAIGLVCDELAGSIPLIGFAGAPFTLACYMIEGGPSKTFAGARRFLYEHPERARRLLNALADSVAQVLKAQVAAGASAVQLFDSWGGTLPRDLFESFALPASKRVMEQVGSDVPRILYLGNTRPYLDLLVDFPVDVVSVDWRTPMREAVSVLGDRFSLQGNLDPCALFASPERLTAGVQRTLDDAAGARGLIFNLGHGIVPQVDPAQVARLVSAVHELSARPGDR